MIKTLDFFASFYRRSETKDFQQNVKELERKVGMDHVLVHCMERFQYLKPR